MNDRPRDEYNESVGSVMQARKDYEAACTAHGTDSWPAEQAKEYLDRQIKHREVMRVRHDLAEREGTNG